MTAATFTLRRSLRGKTLKAWRNAHKLSAAALARELGVSRQYVKSIEGGSLAASQKFIKKFDALRAEWGEGTVKEEAPKLINLVCKFDLPNSFEILAKPRRCKGCHKYFVPIVPTQRMHNTAECRRNARKNARKKRK